jgi:hypothetical protein
MKRNLIAVSVLAVAFGVSAHAEDKASGNEFFYQTGAGASSVTGSLGYQFGSTTAKGASTDTKESGLNPIGVEYEYGINEMFSVGGNLQYQSTTIDSGGKTKPTRSGLRDPNIFAKGVSAMGFGNLRYGLNLDLGFQKLTIDSSGNYNAASGGFAITPYVGIDSALGGGTVGGKLSYTNQQDRTVSQSGSADFKVKGGDTVTLTAFYEMMFSDMLAGADLSYASVAKTTQNSSGTDVDYIRAFSVVTLDLYGKIPVAGFELLPKLSVPVSVSGDAYDKYSTSFLTVSGRWMF